MVAVTCAATDRQAIEDQINASGYDVATRTSDASFALIDVDTAADSNEIGEALEAGCRTIVFGSQIDDMYTMALRAQGVWRVVSRDTAMSDLAAVLPALV